MPSVLSAKHFHDEQAAYEFLEARVWPNGAVCPHCGGFDRISKMGGKATRIGLYKCYQCRKQFTVKVGTVFESSHVPLNVWLQAVALLTSSKKGISSNQLHRVLGVTLKTAWFMSHRIREAMRSGDLAPMGSGGGIVEADETYQGRRSTPRDVRTSGRPFIKKGKKGTPAKRAIIALVERGGSVRSFHVENADKSTVNQIVSANISREAHVMTDESRLYKDVAGHAASHRAVKHAAGEYVRYEGEAVIHSNTVENVFSILKRGMGGVYQHCKEKHLHRYLAEFDFRYNNRIGLGVNDQDRAENALRGIVGKRLTYQTTRQG
jgi:transposase-like protein